MQIKQKVKAIFKDKKGLSYIYIAVIVIILAMIFGVVLEYASVFTITSNAKKNMEMELESLCTQKVIAIYEAMKDGDDVPVSDYTAEYKNIIIDRFSLKPNEASSWKNPDDPNNVMYIFENPVTATIEDKTLSLEFEFVYVVPMKFTDLYNTNIEIPMKITAQHKFIE